VLKGGTVIPADRDAFTVTRSLPHGHVAAVLGSLRKTGLERILGPAGNRCRDLIIALIVGRILDPVSKLAAARALSPATATSSLGEVLDLGWPIAMTVASMLIPIGIFGLVAILWRPGSLYFRSYTGVLVNLFERTTLPSHDERSACYAPFARSAT
jgi:hypothetical protein